MTVWERYEASFTSEVTDPKASLFLTYRGGGDVALKSLLFTH